MDYVFTLQYSILLLDIHYMVSYNMDIRDKKNHKENDNLSMKVPPKMTVENKRDRDNEEMLLFLRSFYRDYPWCNLPRTFFQLEPTIWCMRFLILIPRTRLVDSSWTWVLSAKHIEVNDISFLKMRRSYPSIRRTPIIQLIHFYKIKTSTCFEIKVG